MSTRAKIIIISTCIIATVMIAYFYNAKYSELITIEAHYMQYACGEGNDDMQVEKVNSEAFHSLIGKDIDPHVFAVKNTLQDYFYENKTEKFHFTFRLTGYISKDALSGCDEGAPKFYVKKIERLDGSNPKTNWDFY